MDIAPTIVIKSAIKADHDQSVLEIPANLIISENVPSPLFNCKHIAHVLVIETTANKNRTLNNCRGANNNFDDDCLPANIERIDVHMPIVIYIGCIIAHTKLTGMSHLFSQFIFEFSMLIIDV